MGLSTVIFISSVVFIAAVCLLVNSYTEEQADMVHNGKVVEVRKTYDSYQKSLTFIGSVSICILIPSAAMWIILGIVKVFSGV